MGTVMARGEAQANHLPGQASWYRVQQQQVLNSRQLWRRQLQKPSLNTCVVTWPLVGLLQGQQLKMAAETGANGAIIAPRCCFPTQHPTLPNCTCCGC